MASTLRIKHADMICVHDEHCPIVAVARIRESNTLLTPEDRAALDGIILSALVIDENTDEWYCNYCENGVEIGAGQEENI